MAAQPMHALEEERRRPMAHSRHRRFVSIAVVVLVCLAARQSTGEENAAEELRRELEAMKKQMQQMQQKIESQERLLEKLTAERKVPAPSQPIAAAPAPAASPAPAAASETQEQMEKRVTESVMRK